jgi:carboxymethylenebutenolidase
MSGETVKIRANGSGEFDCYVVAPKSDTPVPAIVLASAIHGVDPDIKEIADEFAAKGFIAAAPDLFWRSVPGPLDRDDERAAKRSQPRLEKIKAGEQDLMDTLAHLRTLPQFNGNAAVMGFCYGGPYSILGPKRLGFAAGISCPMARSYKTMCRSSMACSSRFASFGVTAITSRPRRCLTCFALCPSA